MRFIRQEEIITTICNQEVKEAEYISRLMQKLKDESIYFVLSIKKYYQSDYIERTITYDKVKVMNVHTEEETVDFYIYKDTSLIKMNGVKFDEISEIFALTKKNDLLHGIQNGGIFDYIDLED